MGLLDCILCLLRADISKSLLVSQHWHVHVQISIKELCLLNLSLLLQSAMHILFILFKWFVWWEVSGHTSAFFVGYCFQDLFKTACSILVWFPSSFFSMCFVSIHVVHPYSSMNTATTWKKYSFISLDRSDFYKIDYISIVVHAFTRGILALLCCQGMWTGLLT